MECKQKESKATMLTSDKVEFSQTFKSVEVCCHLNSSDA